MTTKLLASLLAAAVLSGPALAQPYVQLDLGATALWDSRFDQRTTAYLGISAGYRLENVALEAGVAYFGKDRVQAGVVEVRGLFQPFTFGQITPYGLASLGYSFLGGDVLREAGHEKNGLTVGVGLGVRWDFMDRWSMDLRYVRRFSDKNGVRRSNGGYDQWEPHAFTIGLVYSW